MKFNETEWLEDFRDFVEVDRVAVPEKVSHKILQSVARDLDPSPWWVFAKLFSIHAFVGTLSLAVCDQFGVSPFRTGFSLSNYFMKFGHSACMVLCGSLFLGLSVWMAWLALSREEFKVLGRHSLLQVSVLGAVSLAVFWGLGAQVFLEVAAFWFFGAMAGGLLPLVILRRRIL